MLNILVPLPPDDTEIGKALNNMPLFVCRVKYWRYKMNRKLVLKTTKDESLLAKKQGKFLTWTQHASELISIRFFYCF